MLVQSSPVRSTAAVNAGSCAKVGSTSAMAEAASSLARRSWLIALTAWPASRTWRTGSETSAGGSKAGTRLADSPEMGGVCPYERVSCCRLGVSVLVMDYEYVV